MQLRTNCLKRLALSFTCSNFLAFSELLFLRFVAPHASVRALSLGTFRAAPALACHVCYAIS